MSQPAPARFAPIQIALHWLIVVLFVFNYFVSEGMGRALHMKLDGTAVSGFVPSVHPPVGIVILVLMLIRVAVRLRLGAPALPAGNNPLMDKAAHWAHLALYALLIALPIAGIMAWGAGIEAMGDVHGALANIAMTIVVLHAAAALYHQFILKDNLLARMRPGAK